jgi:hypothetical protein
MTPEVSTVLKAALQLTPEQRRELIAELSRSSHRSLRPKTGDVTRYFGTIDSGDPSSGDNEKIDADLAAAYADDHEDDD